MNVAMPVAQPNQLYGRSSTPRLRDEGLTEQDRKYALAIHLTALIGVFIHLALIVPLVLWLVRKDKSAYVDDHGREMMNVFLTGLVLVPVCMVSIIGIPLAIAWAIATFIGFFRGVFAASRGEYFRYPMTIRFLQGP